MFHFHIQTKISKDHELNYLRFFFGESRTVEHKVDQNIETPTVTPELWPQTTRANFRPQCFAHRFALPVALVIIRVCGR